MSQASQSPVCSRCGAPLSADALKGLCPRCLMALNLAAPTEIPGEVGPHGTKVFEPPPTTIEIAKHFPQFEILECLGRGGMGVVYKARQPKLNRMVALKVLAPEKVAETKFAERFEREAQALARLNHPNIVTVYDFGEVDGLYYLLMEFVDGVSLRPLLQTRKIAPEEALAIVPKICEALQFAHEQGVVHRDIKPENVLLDKKGRVKIADFGIAKIVGGVEPPLSPMPGERGAVSPGEKKLTQDQVLGTPHYMAPEQVEKPQLVDHRADIYSLGVVFYEMLTGELPLGKFQPPSHKVQVDVRLDEVVLRTLEKELERRYQHASQVKSDVETIAQTQSDVPPRSSSAAGAAQPKSNGNAWKIAAGIAVLILVLVALLIAGLLASRTLPALIQVFKPSISSPVSAGLISRWRAENSTADDVGGNHGTIAGSGQVDYQPGIAGQAFVLYVTHRDRVDVCNPANLQLQDFTIAAWIKRSSSTRASFDILGADGSQCGEGGMIFSYGRGGYGFGLLNNGRMFLSRIDLDAVHTASRVSDREWHHVVVTKSGTKVVFYLDGEPESAPAYDHPSPYTFDTSAAIGSRGDERGGTFFGMIDEVSVYGRALSAAEVLKLGKAGLQSQRGAISLPSSQVRKRVPALPGLVAWWRGDNSTADDTGRNHGTIAGSGQVDYEPGIAGQAFVFDGTHRDRVDVGNPANLRLQDFTIAAWIKRSSPTTIAFDILGEDGSQCGEGGMVFGYGHAGYGFALLHNGQLVLSRIDLDGVFSESMVSDTDWHHVAVTKTGTDVVFYIDGEPEPVPTYDHPSPYTFDTSAAIGSRGDELGNTFFGMIDEVMVFDRVLSAVEIQKLGEAGRVAKGQRKQRPAPNKKVSVPAPSGMVSWWPGEGNALDLSGGNKGTLAGDTTYGTGQVGKGFLFDGSSDGVLVGNPINLQMQDFTIETWMRRSDPAIVTMEGGDAEFFAYGSGGYAFGINNDGTLFLSKADVNGVTLTSPLIADTAWHHVAVTKNGNSVVFYIDGVSYSVPQYKTTFVFESDAAIGARGDNLVGSFYGTVDELSIYDRALTRHVIQSIHSAGRAGKRLRPGQFPKEAKPAGWWQAEGNAKDTAGDADGLLVGNIRFLPGSTGRAFNFDGRDGYVKVPATSTTDVGNGDGLTLSAWIKPSAVDTERPIVEWNSETGGNPFPYGVHLWISVPKRDGGNGPGCLFANLVDGQGEFHCVTSAAGLITPRVFQHVAVTYNRNSGWAALYHNGVVVAQAKLGRFKPQTSFDLFFGKRAGGLAEAFTFAGQMDEIAIYARALNPDEVRSIFNNGDINETQRGLKLRRKPAHFGQTPE